MKQSIKVLILLGLAIACTNAAGPVTKKLGEVRRKTLAQAQDTEIGLILDAECLIDANAEALADIQTCEELEPTLEFCECDNELPGLHHGEIVRQSASVAATATVAIASIPAVSAQCQATETCCACAQTNQEARESNEVRRHVEFNGSICVEEYSAYKAKGEGSNNHNWEATKNAACVVNNHDNDAAIEEDLCPPELAFCPEDE